MTLDALTAACYDAQRFRYISDGVRAVDEITIPSDVWESNAEFERKGGGDCENFAFWTIVEAAQQSSPLALAATLHFVAGEVLVRNPDTGEMGWVGHGWVELVIAGICYWCDPAWGRIPQSKESLGSPETRRPVMRWRYDGQGFTDEEAYG